MLTIQDCKKRTGRTYPEGYGYALAVLDNAGNCLGDILDATFGCVRHHFRKGARDHDADIAAFVAAWESRPQGRMEGGHPAQYWLIEAAQVLVQWGLWTGCPGKLRIQIHDALRKAGHPGY